MKPSFEVCWTEGTRTYLVARQQVGNAGASILWKECDLPGNDISQVLDKSQLSFQQLGNGGKESERKQN